jgi:DNA replication protein DnaC
LNSPSGGPRQLCLGLPCPLRDSVKLLQEFTAALADGSFAKMLEEYARVDLLLIDEFGFDRLERTGWSQASNFYYCLLAARTGQRSTALVTNIDFKA